MSSFPSGLYTITSKATGRPIGIPTSNDSVTPPVSQPVLQLSEGYSPEPLWSIVLDHASSSNSATIKTAHGPTTVLDHYLYTFLQGDELDDRWIVEPVSQHGPDAFVIRRNIRGEERAWVVDTEDKKFSKVMVDSVLTVTAYGGGGAGIPYPLSQVFIIQPSK